MGAGARSLGPVGGENVATKKIRFLTGIASADWSYAPRQEEDIEETQADAWIASGIAAPVTKAAPETAALRTPETAARSPAKAKGR